MVGGNLKPDPLDMPRRRLGREERKEAFKREVEITKRVLKKVNIEVRQALIFPEEACVCGWMDRRSLRYIDPRRC